MASDCYLNIGGFVQVMAIDDSDTLLTKSTNRAIAMILNFEVHLIHNLFAFLLALLKTQIMLHEA